MKNMEEKVVKEAVDWITKIRPELQVEELTAAMQKAIWSHGQYIQGMVWAVGLLGVGVGSAWYYARQTRKDFEKFKHEQMMRNAYDDVCNKEN